MESWLDSLIAVYVNSQKKKAHIQFYDTDGTLNKH